MKRLALLLLPMILVACGGGGSNTTGSTDGSTDGTTSGETWTVRLVDNRPLAYGSESHVGVWNGSSWVQGLTLDQSAAFSPSQQQQGGTFPIQIRQPIDSVELVFRGHNRVERKTFPVDSSQIVTLKAHVTRENGGVVDNLRIHVSSGNIGLSSALDTNNNVEFVLPRGTIRITVLDEANPKVYRSWTFRGVQYAIDEIATIPMPPTGTVVDEEIVLSQ
jgi:hypothetical protein